MLGYNEIKDVIPITVTIKIFCMANVEWLLYMYLENELHFYQ